MSVKINKQKIEEIYFNNICKILAITYWGQKQRALIALAIAQDTETIVLDEPTNHLDI